MSSFDAVKTRSRNLLIYGGITAMTGAAMLGIGSSALAQDSTPAAGTEESTAADDRATRRAERQAERQAEYDAFLDQLAANLGVADGETVDAAIRTTLKQRIDARLAAGEISADRATALKAAIDAGEFPIGLRLPGLGGGDHDGRGGRHDRDGRGSGKDIDDTLTPVTGTPTAGGKATA